MGMEMLQRMETLQRTETDRTLEKPPRDPQFFLGPSWSPFSKFLLFRSARPFPPSHLSLLRPVWCSPWPLSTHQVTPRGSVQLDKGKAENSLITTSQCSGLTLFSCSSRRYLYFQLEKFVTFRTEEKKPLRKAVKNLKSQDFFK
jgi:hypothetical protein